MERFVRLVAPTNRVDFCTKLIALVLICGIFNHLRDLVTDGFDQADPFMNNLFDASFTALPMCAFALLLISHLNALQTRLYKQAMRDTLTGLFNRRWFMANTPEQISAGQALMIVDIDYFKRINDTFGHDKGDEALTSMAKHLDAQLGEYASCARIGGEEFAIFFARSVPEELTAIARAISSGFLFEAEPDKPQKVTASVGLVYGREGLSRVEAIKLADEAVYQAKENGRACFSEAESSPKLRVLP
ncbi:MAG: GGDEF domain-containing protein [Litoreibacter sp.]|nr:GGDEF domain-containing protein [Litoreibacter sp.]